MIAMISKLLVSNTHTRAHANTYARTLKHKFCLQLMVLFSIASALFHDFLPNQTHIVRISLILRNTVSIVDSI